MADSGNLATKTTMSSLPKDIITHEIFAKFPAKSLLHFKCVSKSYNALISSPEFVQLHLNETRSSDANRLLFLAGADNRNLYSIDIDTPDDSVTRIPLPPTSDEGRPQNVSIVGSVDGLICVVLGARIGSFSQSKYIIVNPSTRVFREIPYSHTPIVSFSDNIRSSFEFGFDDSKEDIRSSFGFGSDDLKKDIRSSFGFEFDDLKEDIRSSFGFGYDDLKEDIRSSFGFEFNSLKEDIRSSFGFGFDDLKEDIRSSFGPGFVDLKEDIRSNFGFGFNNLKEDIQSSFGFGFDDLNHDYKLVTVTDHVVRFNLLFNNDVAYNYREVMVYSLNQSRWKLVEHVNNQIDSVMERQNGVLLKNHLLHWLFSNSNHCRIGCFDTRSDKWVRDVPLMPLIEYSYNNKFRVRSIGVINGCLCISTITTSMEVLWMLKEYEAKESWVKLFHITNQFRSSPFLCFRKESKYEVLVANLDREELFWFDFGPKTYGRIKSFKRIPGLVEGCLFTESLVQIPGGRPISQDKLNNLFSN